MIAPAADDSHLDEDRLAGWLEARGVWQGPLTATRISAGGSNELFELRGGASTLVLRRPPKVISAPGAHDVIRETRVLEALEKTELPHPQLVAVGRDLDVIGSPFYVMKHVDGFAGRVPIPERFDEPAARHELATAAIDALAAIAALDIERLGLADFGRPDGFLERQVPRWLGQLDRYRTRALPHLDELAEWLKEHQPASQRTSLLHGDFQLINLMFAAERPGRVTAVLDWEMSTIGDPLADLGWFLAGWEERGEPSYRAYPQLSVEAGMPTRRELAARYAGTTGLSVETLRYYEVLALFKLACIMEGSHVRFASGHSDNPLHASLADGVPRMLARAQSFADGTLT
jgi:aminoglycoside phosphotransferase (APT) family kinase protein